MDGNVVVHDEATSVKRKRSEIESENESQTPNESPVSSRQALPSQSDSQTPRESPIGTSSSQPTGEDVIPQSNNAIPSTEALIASIPNHMTGKEKSDVWQHFIKVKAGNAIKAECKYCHKQLGGSSNDGTRHLRHHIDKSCPKRINRDLRQMLLSGNQGTVDGQANLGCGPFDQAGGRLFLAEMIILHEYPLSMVDHYGFRRFCNKIQPLFKVVSRNTIKKDILQIYDIAKGNQMKILEKNRGRIAITCDMWTADKQNKGYMAITAHYIDSNWKLNSRLIRFVYVPHPHTKDVLSPVLEDCFFEWNIDRKLSTITVDNCTTNDAIIQDLIYKLPSNALMLDGELFHMRCCAHILNLIVQDGLSVIIGEISTVRGAVSFWKGSPKREQKFEEACRQLGMSYSKKLILDCKTRWNSAYEMLVVALEYKDVFTRLRNREPLYTCVPSTSDWNMTSVVCEKLNIFYEATKAFSGSQYPTANVFFPTICSIRIDLAEWIHDEHPIISSMASKMIDKYNKYWTVVHGIMGVATVLDPRFKMSLLDFYFPTIYSEAQSVEEIRRIKTIVCSLFDEYKTKDAQRQARQANPAFLNPNSLNIVLFGY